MTNNMIDDMGVVQTEQIQNTRPKRDRRQNVRYSSQEYDLSVVSSVPERSKHGKFTLSGVYVKPEAEKQLKKNMRKKGS